MPHKYPARWLCGGSGSTDQWIGPARALARAGIATGQRRPGEPVLCLGEREAEYACKSLLEPRVRSGRPGSEGSNMSKSPSGRKRATQASPPTGKSEPPPAPAPRETEPQRVEPKSPSGRKRATQASPPTGKSEPPPAPAPRETEPQRVEPKSPSGRKRATQASPPTGKNEPPPAPVPRKPNRSGSSPRAPLAGSGPPRPLPRPARTNRRRPPCRAKPNRSGSRRVAFRRPSARGERTGVPPPSRSRSTPTTSGWRGASPSAPTGTTGSKPSGNSRPWPEGTGSSTAGIGA